MGPSWQMYWPSFKRRPVSNGVEASPNRRAKESPAEHIPTMPDVYVHNLLSMKRFHEALAENVHECSL